MAADPNRLEEIQGELARFGRDLTAESLRVTVDGRRAYAVEFQRISNLLALMHWLASLKVFDEAPLALRLLVARLIETLSGTQVLLSTGFPSSAANVVRSLFEASAHLKLILGRQDRVRQRCRLFENYIHVRREKGLAKSPALSRAEKAANRARYLAVEHDYHRLGHTWYWKIVGAPKNAGREATFRQLCRFTRLLGRYEALYPHLSDADHPTPALFSWIQTPDGRLHVSPMFDDKVRSLEGLATPLAGEALLRVLRYLKPPDLTEIEVLLVGILRMGKAET